MMINKKLMATLSLLGIVSLIIGNLLDSLTYWVYSDIYIGILLAVVSYMLFKA